MSSKVYIFITPSIVEVGGAQTYLYNKAVTLQNLGWKVIIFSGLKGRMIIPFEASGIEEYKFDFLCHPTFYCFKRSIKSNLKKLVNKIPPSKYIIIESTCIAQSTWGELLSAHLKAKHLIYLLQEDNTTSLTFKEYFSFKNRRNELAGISVKSMTSLFTSWGMKDEKINILRALGCTKVTSSLPSHWEEDIKSIDCDFKIASIGRLDKPFVRQMIEDLYEYINHNSTQKFLIVLFGGAEDKALEKSIQKKLDSLNNCKLIITGFIFPLPESIFPLFNLFIGSAGSSTLPTMFGSLSLSYDSKDNMPIGLVNITTSNRLFRSDNEVPIPLSLWLDKILKEQKYKAPENLKKIHSLDYSSHFDLINQTKIQDYYDIMTLKVKGIKMFIRKLVLVVFGNQIYEKTSKKINRVSIQNRSITL